MTAVAAEPKKKFDIRKLDTEEGRREYYRYDLRNPETMVHHVEPYLDPRFNKELLARYGSDPNGDPRIRIAWAGTLRQVNYREVAPGKTEAYHGRKYSFMRIKVQTGFSFLDTNGKRTVVANLWEVPQKTAFEVVSEYDDLGVMKFVLEMKFTAEEMVTQGWWPEFGTEEYDNFCVKDGARFAAPPDPKGAYRLAHYIETSDGEYRDVVQADVDQIVEIINRGQNETEEDFIKRKQREREEIAAAAQAAQELLMQDIIADGIVRAEKKFARGNVVSIDLGANK